MCIAILVAVGFLMKKRQIIPEQDASMVLAKLIINLSRFETDVLVILMSMPAAALNVAIARKYGCDAELAANLTLTSIYFSALSRFISFPSFNNRH